MQYAACDGTLSIGIQARNSLHMEFYPIFELRSDSPTVIEQLDSKRKLWFLMEGNEQPWSRSVAEKVGHDVYL